MSRLRLLAGKRDPWTPWVIPRSKLVGFYDAEVNSTITQSGGAVSAISDLMNPSVNFGQGTGANQPALITSPVTGRQVIKPDGVDDNLIASAVTPYPTNVPCEFIFIGTQQTASGGSNEVVVSLGNGTANGSMTLTKFPQLSLRFALGSGSAAVTPATPAGSATGACIMHGKWDGTNAYSGINGVFTAGQAIAMSLTATRSRLFAGSNTSAASFGAMAMSALLIIKGNLTATEWTTLLAATWTRQRLGLA